MGSFNLSCCISELPISEETPVKLILLEEYKGPNKCYSNRWWEPLNFPISATYNDYGSFTNIQEGPCQEFWIVKPVQKLMTQETWNLETLLKSIRDSSIKIQSFRESVILEIAAVRLDVWQGLLKAPLLNSCWRGDSLSTFEEYRESFIAFHQDIKNRIKDPHKLLNFNESQNPFFLSIWEGLGGTACFPWQRILFRDLIFNLKSDVPEFLDSVVEMLFVTEHMEFLHKKWMPSHYVDLGINLKVWKNYHEMILTVINQEFSHQE